MKAFWWFKENEIAGMARPGFNGIHWFDLPFEEAVVFGWLGQRTSDTQNIQSLKNHIRDYGGKIASFHKVDEPSFQRILNDFENTPKILEVFGRIAERTKCIDHIEITNDKITFRLSPTRLNWEIEFLKKQEIQTVVTLTENHNQKEELEGHFKLHHLAIEDLNAPQFEQVLHLAEIIRNTGAPRKRIAVHCMAGIGRTSTMLMAAHLVLGEKLGDLRARLEKQNPTFKFNGPQAKFIESVAIRMQTDK